MREILLAVGIPVLQIAALVVIGLIFRVDRRPEGDE